MFFVQLESRSSSWWRGGRRWGGSNQILKMTFSCLHVFTLLKKGTALLHGLLLRMNIYTWVIPFIEIYRAKLVCRNQCIFFKTQKNKTNNHFGLAVVGCVTSFDKFVNFFEETGNVLKNNTGRLHLFLIDFDEFFYCKNYTEHICALLHYFF